ncbi:hypothetical protein AO826_18375 [Xanthomonas phaseoli pv. manihotis]|nr:hypothetical protein AO826_18375 [Xanthomonas phaseoli pv. manihotis]OCG81492.1 hypothetical protein XEULMG905_20395 [Xanthomonas euvesicatoria]
MVEHDHARHHGTAREMSGQAGMIMRHNEIHKRRTQILG